MRSSVCIVLNEREPSKAIAAAGLEEALANTSIGVERLPVTADILDQIIARSPQILVIDYLLGDWSTGLDVLTGLGHLPPAQHPLVIFLTDEPSVQVAVNALKAGAIDYIPLETPQALEATIAAIRSGLRLARRKNLQAVRQPPMHLSGFVCMAETTRAMVDQARVAVSSAAQLVLLRGQSGSGRGTLARAMHQERSGHGPLRHVDLSLVIGDLLSALALPHEKVWSPPSSPSIIIDNVDQDDGELLELLGHFFRPEDSGLHPSSFQCGTFFFLCCPAQARTQEWQRLCGDLAVIDVPAISERTADIPELVRVFTTEAQRLTGLNKVPPWDESCIQAIKGLPMPGNLTQLRAIVTNVAINAALGTPPSPQRILEHAALWEDTFAQAGLAAPDPLRAAMMLELCGHHYRAAAARLGCSTQQLLATLHGAGEHQL